MVKRFKQGVYEFEAFRLDVASSMLYRDGAEVLLPPKAIETLLALVERSGEIVSTSELMGIIWSDTIVEESNLSLYLHLLRKTLGNTKDGTPFIETLRRRGYRFNGNVTVLSDGTTEVEAQEQPDIYHGKKNRLVYLAAAVVPILLLAVFAASWFRTPPVTVSSAKEDLTFLNMTSGEDVNFATISPNGNYIVYSSHDGENVHLWLQQTGQSSRLEIIPPLTGGIFGTTFTPDSQFVYFIAGENADATNTANELYRVPASGGLPSKVLTDINTPVSFSPDGKELVFVRRNQSESRSSVVIASSDGTREGVALSQTGDDAIVTAAWSPDNDVIAYGTIKTADRQGQCTIAAIGRQSGQTKILSNEKWDSCFRMGWTPDGKGLVFVGTKSGDSSSTRRDQIYFLSIDSGESRRLTTDGSRHQYASLGITNTSDVIAVPFNRLSQIWAMESNGDSRTAVQITKGFADGRSGIAALADGRIAYLTRNGDGFSIWLMSSDGADRMQLTTEPSEIEELRGDHAGQFFVFSARRETGVHLTRVDTSGANLKQLTFGESHEIDSTISPDGKWIIYNSYVYNGNYGRSNLWKIPSDGGEPILITDVECTAPHFSPDGKFVSCVSPDLGKILIISVDTGKVVQTVQPVENSVLNIGSRWTPDGKALTYIVYNNNCSNIWSHRIDELKPKPLTDFTSGEIYNYAYSVDGSRLHIARGYPVRNAMLIQNFK